MINLYDHINTEVSSNEDETIIRCRVMLAYNHVIPNRMLEEANLEKNDTIIAVSNSIKRRMVHEIFEDYLDDLYKLYDHLADRGSENYDAIKMVESIIDKMDGGR